MTKPPAGMGRLRELLLDEETARLASLDRRLDQVDVRLQHLGEAGESEARAREAISRQIEGLMDRAGTRERFEDSVAEILDSALAKAEATNHREMSRAVAPLVIDTVRSELRNSQDEMVEALYPITGRLVQAYVANAMRELAAKVNRGLGQNRLALRIRSLMTGRSMADLAMAAVADLQLEELYFIRRGSGELIARWPRHTPMRNRDIHLGRILSSITDFANHAFEAEGGHIRRFEADTFLVFLRASPMYIVAAKCNGTPPPGFDSDFDDTFLTALTDVEGDDEGLPVRAGTSLAAMAETLEDRLEEAVEANTNVAAGFGILKFILFLIAVPVFAWLAWSGFTSLEEARIRNAANGVITSMPALNGYRTDVDVGYRGRTVSVTGLTPSDASRAELIERLEAALPSGTRLVTELASLPAPPPSLQPEVNRLRQQVESVRAQVQTEAETEAMARALAEVQQLITTTRTELQALTEQNRPEPSPDQLASVRAALVALGSRAGAMSANFETLEKAEPGFTGQLLPDLHQAIADLNQALRGFGLEAVAFDADASPPAGANPNSAPGLAAGTLIGGLERLSASVATLRNVPIVRFEPTPLDKLEAWIGSNAIFFANGIAFRNPETAAAKLDAIAELINAAGRQVRVVGFTDERGGLDRNNELAQSRAEAVAQELVARGIAADRLIAVGRPGGRYDISPIVGQNSPNRRVQFELGFFGEAN